MINKTPSQSILDVCLQHTGGISSLIDFMKLNNMDSLQLPETGSVLIPPVIRASIVNEYASKSITVGSIDSSFYPVPHVYQLETITYMNAIGIIGDDTVYYPGTFQEITGEGLWLAIDLFVVILKLSGTWSKMQLIYPFIGASDESHAFNLVSEAYTIDWFGGIQHNRFGVKFNGTTGYGNTNFNTSEFANPASIHISYFNRNNFGYGYPAGSKNGYTPNGSVTISHDTSQCYIWMNSDGFYSTTFDSQTGLFVHTRTDNTNTQIYKRSTDETFSYDYEKPLNATIFNDNIFIGATNNAGTPQFFASCQLSFMSIGSGLTESDVDALDLALTTLNTALGRNL